MKHTQGFTVGLTGGIASGKSSVARLLRDLGATVIDADQLARAAVAPGSTGLAEVTEAFGEEVLLPDGSLDRAAVAARVFSDDAARAALNAIIHPRVRAAAAEQHAAAVAREGARAVVVQDIPLLVETGQAGNFDVVVTVEAPAEERVRRMMQERGMSEEEAEARMSAQASDAERAAAADVVLRNDGTLSDLEYHVRRFWDTWIEPRRAEVAQ